MCKVLPKMNTTGDETITLDTVERGALPSANILPW